MRKLAVRDERVKVLARFREEGSVLRGDKHGMVESFEIQLSLDSDLPQQEIIEMMRLAHRMCFTEDTLSKEVKPVYQHFLNGQPIDIPPRIE